VHFIRINPLFFPVVHMAQHDTTCLPCCRAGTTRLSEVRVVRGPRSRHGVMARHGTTTLSCSVVSCRIVSCLAVSVPCRAGQPIWTSITMAQPRRVAMAARVGLGQLLDNFEDSWWPSSPFGVCFWVSSCDEWMDVAVDGGRGNLLRST
jgi:hypothetical protein